MQLHHLFLLLNFFESADRIQASKIIPNHNFRFCVWLCCGECKFIPLIYCCLHFRKYISIIKIRCKGLLLSSFASYKYPKIRSGRCDFDRFYILSESVIHFFAISKFIDEKLQRFSPGCISMKRLSK